MRGLHDRGGAAMDIRAFGETEKAVGFSATWEAFKATKEEHKVREWQEAYFQLMSIDNTYSVFYEMGIKDYRVSQGHYSVRFFLIAKAAYEKKVEDWLAEHFDSYDKWVDDIVLIDGWSIQDAQGKDFDLCFRVYEA